MTSKSKKSIAILGGSFDPPGENHRKMAIELAKHFDVVKVIPCGHRPDKPRISDTDTLHRATMTVQTFSGLERVEVLLFDLESDEFTRNWQLQEMFQDEGEVWHVVGTDLVKGGAKGESKIQKEWVKGPEIWRTFNFCVFKRPDQPAPDSDMPTNCKVLNAGIIGASTIIREKVFRCEEFDSLVVPSTADYIRRYGLYRGSSSIYHAPYQLTDPRPLVFYDDCNPRALSMAEPFLKIADPDNPNCIVVCGGDGMMAYAMRSHWKKRLPFIGVNAGHVGYMLNDSNHISDVASLCQPASIRQFPLLYVEVTDMDGNLTRHHGVNDAWVERTNFDTAWIEVKVNNEEYLPHFIADGILVASTLGSSAYAQKMGARPLRIDDRALLMVGSNPGDPFGWKEAALAFDSVVEFRVVNPDKRPIRGAVDGSDVGQNIRSMKVRASRIAAVELVFVSESDIAKKRDACCFPGK